MQTRLEPKLKRYHFDSLNELGEWITNTPRTWREKQSESNPASMNWDLNAGYAKSVEMAKYGWLEGAEKVQDALQAFVPATPQPDSVTDFYGFRPHVPRFCAGAPDSMIRHAPVATMGGGRILTLGVSVDANGFVSAQYMSNYGVAIVQYVNQLETQGIRVELIGICLGEFGSYGRMCHTVTIKSADQPLDLAVVAFAIGHPAMLRRLSFALIERSAIPCNDDTRDYGRATDARASDIINHPPGTVVLNGMKDANTIAKTPQAALKHVTKMIDAAMEKLYGDATA